MKKRRVLAISPVATDSTSFWRAVGPLSRIDHNQIEITFNRQDSIQWDNLIGYDILFFQRPCHTSHGEIIETAKLMGLKIWLDFDDDLMQVPETNPTFKTFGTQEFKDAFSRIIRMADLITVTTQHLADRFRGIGVEVIPNAWDDQIFEIPKKENHPPRFLWRGGPTHDDDLMSVADGFSQLSKEFPDAEFYFLGKPNPRIRKCFQPKQYANLGAFDPIKFYHTLRLFEGSVNLIPLEDNEFNKSKSNIGIIEGTIAGCASVAPLLTYAWDIPGVTHYKGPEGFFEAAKNAFEHAHFNYLKTREYVVEKLLLKKVNKKRETLILGL